jgi:5-methylcytosine-specific restriction endonuclease McrA
MFNKGYIPWNKGGTSWNKGKTKKDTPSLTHSGVKPGNVPWNRGKRGEQVAWNRGLIGYNSGENHYNWNGGVTSLYYKIRNSLKYRLWRSDIFLRDNFTCQERFSEIIKRFRLNDIESAMKCEALWNLNNGITLCIKCHSKTPNFGRRL